MAVHNLNSCKLYMHEYDLSTDHFRMELTHAAEALENTAFGDTTRSHISGLQTVNFTGEGYFQADGTSAVDDVIDGAYNVTNKIITVAPLDGAVGSPAKSFTSIIGEYRQPSNPQIGELYTYEVSATTGQFTSPADTKYVKGGIIFHALGAETTTSGSTSIQLGAVTAGQTVFCVIHITALSGSSPILTIDVRHDDNSGMTSPNILGGVFGGALTTVQADIVNDVLSGGTTTDDWWDVQWTLSGGTPSFTFLVTLGIQ